MANEVKWIKFMVTTFDGESFKRIKKAQIGGQKFRDKLTAVWFELLSLAGKCNKNGFLLNKEEMPYNTFEDIALMLDREIDEIELCMKFYLEQKMIVLIDDIYKIYNWEIFQNAIGLKEISEREQNRIRQAKHREKAKNVTSVTVTRDTNVTLRDNNALDIDIDIDKDKEYNSIFAEKIILFWNEKKIIQHNLEKTKNIISKDLAKVLKVYTIEEVFTAIQNYGTIINDKNAFFKYKWSLHDFLNRKNGLPTFLNDGSNWVNYISNTTSPKSFPKNQRLVEEPEWMKKEVELKTYELTEEEKKEAERLKKLFKTN